MNRDTGENRDTLGKLNIGLLVINAKESVKCWGFSTLITFHEVSKLRSVNF